MMKTPVETKTPGKERSKLLNYLWDYQRQHGYIRDVDVAECAHLLGLSRVEVEGVISFYHFFHRTPTGKFVIYLNNSVTSEIKGYQRVKEAFERETATTFGAPELSGLFTLRETACIGLSDQEPAALINFYPFTNLTSLKVQRIIRDLRKGRSPSEIADEVSNHVRHVPPKEKCVFFRAYHPGAGISKLSGMSPEEVIEEVKRAKLSGMGGAFFPTGLKWQLCRKEEAERKYIICNADEGEPGTFKDRVLLNVLPGLMLEGMIIAAYAVGSPKGIVYLRAEYTWLLKKLNRTIEQFYRMGLLGENIAGIEGFNFDIRVQLGAGSYVCGEETALLNSLEGRRGEARARMYFPTQRGYWNLPTVVNNVETFCSAARILELGSDHFLQIGTEQSAGTKLISVSGDCAKPGIYEVEWGITLAEILEMCEASDPWYIQVSGPSGQGVSMDAKDRKIAKEDLRCGGSFMVFHSGRNLINILENFSEFFKHESCGVCTPCRAGNYILQRKLEKIGHGLIYEKDIEEIKSWSRIMQETSRCGLGKTATNALMSAIENFPEYFKGNPDSAGGINYQFDVESAIRDYEQFKA